MLVDPENWRRDDTGPYPVQIAKHRSYCPHCLVTIMPGDAITLRESDTRYSHVRCAEFVTDLEADPNREFVAELAEFRLRQCGPRARRSSRKRKARA